MRPDVNQPVENPKLTELFGQLKNADDTDRNALYESIAEEIALNAYLLAVFRMDEDAIEHNDDGTAVFKQDSSLSFEFLTSADGTHYLPVYTDWRALRKNEQYKDINAKTMIVSFDDMAALCSGKNGIVVNPYSDSFIIRPENVLHMKQHKDIVTKGYTKQTVDKDTKVQIGDPADRPVQMIQAIRSYAARSKRIRTLWLKLMIKEGEKSWLVIVDCDGNPEDVYQGIGQAAMPYLNQGMMIDMVSYADSFGQRAASGKPIYRKRRGLFG